MTNDFDFSDTKQVRKTLIITSFVGICFTVLISHSTGNIKFLGFEIPVNDAPIIPLLICCMIIYEMIVLIIRYNDENLREIYKRKNEYINSFISEKRVKMLSIESYEASLAAETKFKVSPLRVKLAKYGVLFIDIFFPLLLGILAILIIILY